MCVPSEKSLMQNTCFPSEAAVGLRKSRKSATNELHANREWLNWQARAAGNLANVGVTKSQMEKKTYFYVCRGLYQL